MFLISSGRAEPRWCFQGQGLTNIFSDHAGKEQRGGCTTTKMYRNHEENTKVVCESQHISVSKQQLPSPCFTNNYQVYCIRPMAASVAQHHSLQRQLVCGQEWGKASLGQREPGQRKCVERQSMAVFEQWWGGRCEFCWLLGWVYHLLLLPALPCIFCRKSDSNMLTDGPWGLRICSFDCRGATKACAGLDTVLPPCSFCLSFLVLNPNTVHGLKLGISSHREIEEVIWERVWPVVVLRAPK